MGSPRLGSNPTGVDVSGEGNEEKKDKKETTELFLHDNKNKHDRLLFHFVVGHVQTVLRPAEFIVFFAQ